MAVVAPYKDFTKMLILIFALDFSYKAGYNMLHIKQLNCQQYKKEERKMEEKPISLELRRLSLLMSRYMESHTNHRLVEELTGTNSWIIGYIGAKTKKGEDVFQRDLERKFGITRSTASKTVDAMVKKGFLQREGVDYDARLKKLLLTQKACGVLGMMSNDGKMAEAALTKDFSEKEKQNLRDYIERMIKNLKTCSEDSKE